MARRKLWAVAVIVGLLAADTAHAEPRQLGVNVQVSASYGPPVTVYIGVQTLGTSTIETILFTAGSS